MLVAALLERRPAILALRRALPKGDLRVLTARTPAHLEALLGKHLFEAIVLGPAAVRGPVIDALRRDFPALPVVLYTQLRSDDADLLQRARRERVAAVAVEGLDEAVLPKLVRRVGITARRLKDLLPLAPRLGLTEPVQLRAWTLVITDAHLGLDTTALASRLKLRRETLSRQFAAGGAPPLKRAIDAVRLVAAGQLLANPGYKVEAAARLLGFSSVSLLQRTSRRTFGVAARELASLQAEAIVAGLIDDGMVRWR